MNNVTVCVLAEPLSGVLSDGSNEAAQQQSTIPSTTTTLPNSQTITCRIDTHHRQYLFSTPPTQANRRPPLCHPPPPLRPVVALLPDAAARDIAPDRQPHRAHLLLLRLLRRLPGRPAQEPQRLRRRPRASCQRHRAVRCRFTLPLIQKFPSPGASSNTTRFLSTSSATSPPSRARAIISAPSPSPASVRSTAAVVSSSLTHAQDNTSPTPPPSSPSSSPASNPSPRASSALKPRQVPPPSRNYWRSASSCGR